ncbi:hypothetical protein [Stenotrophomonas mori]|uniref:Lipocalin-like domain-containing protein n=1 Tax=Stenotrophomonas mori TaxID=2871096 RepID=A0ABT0SIK0_9GAMM|nr:hypothetical protein [Stenotrophomonas mori]MCL7715134.1 hypothetical protein [Stenotrophomonas mori]
MINRFLALAALLVACIPASSFAQGLKDADIALIVGNWKVLRSIDPMDDSVRCTAVHNNDYSTQLSYDTLFLGIQGGVRGVTLRFDDNPPGRLRIATEIEKRIRSVVISGRDFSQLSNSNRLRYQISTFMDGIITGDLDLDGFSAALDSIRRHCPIEYSPVDSAIPTPTLTTCTADMISKMKEQGLTDEQTSSICK